MKRNIYFLDTFLHDINFINKLIRSKNDVLILNNEMKNKLMEINISNSKELKEAGLTGNSLNVKAAHIKILNKLNNELKNMQTLNRLLDGIIIVLESLTKVFLILEHFVEMMKLLKNIMTWPRLLSSNSP